jgi:hypothetical protein
MLSWLRLNERDYATELPSKSENLDFINRTDEVSKTNELPPRCTSALYFSTNRYTYQVLIVCQVFLQYSLNFLSNSHGVDR